MILIFALLIFISNATIPSHISYAGFQKRIIQNGGSNRPQKVIKTILFNYIV